MRFVGYGLGAGGALLADALAAADTLAAEGVEVEVIDLRTLVPLDADTVLQSVARTRRAVVVHEAVRRGGFGDELAAGSPRHQAAEPAARGIRPEPRS